MFAVQIIYLFPTRLMLHKAELQYLTDTDMTTLITASM